MDQDFDQLERRLREDPADGAARRSLIEAYRRQGERRRLFRLLCEAARRGDDAALVEIEAWNWRRSVGRVYPYRGPWRAGEAVASWERGAFGAVTQAVAVRGADAGRVFCDPVSFAELWRSEATETFVDLVGDDALLRFQGRLILRDGGVGEDLAEADLASEMGELGGGEFVVCHDRLIVSGGELSFVFDLGADFGRRLYTLPESTSDDHWARGHLLTLRAADERGDLFAYDARGRTRHRFPGAAPLLEGGNARCLALVHGRLIERGFRRQASGAFSSSLRLIEADLSGYRSMAFQLARGQRAPYETLIDSDAFSCWTVCQDALFMTELVGSDRVQLFRLDARDFPLQAIEDFRRDQAPPEVILAPESAELRWLRELDGLSDVLLCEAGLLALLSMEGRERIELLDPDTGATRDLVYEAPRAAGPPARLIPGPRGLYLERRRDDGGVELLAL